VGFLCNKRQEAGAERRCANEDETCFEDLILSQRRKVKKLTTMTLTCLHFNAITGVGVLDPDYVYLQEI